MIDAPGAAITLPSWRVERILSDENGFLVVDKPVGMPVHGGNENLAHSVVERLGIWLLGQSRDKYLAVHQRLDQETSGLLFFVTDKEKNTAVARAMESHAIARTYLAVVGSPRGAEPDGTALSLLKDEGRIELWLSHISGKSTVSAHAPARGRSKAKKGKNRTPAPAVNKSLASKRAITHYKVLRRSGDRALVELRLETGRTHQIRATLAHLGLPIVGDSLYGGQSAYRLMLHAHRLSGGPLQANFVLEAPEVFESALLNTICFPEAFESALSDAACLRAPLLTQTSVFRLVNGAGDGLPNLTVDAYGRFATLNLYDTELVERQKELAEAVLQLGFSGVYVKKRIRADLRKEDPQDLAPEGPTAGQSAPETYCVDELGLQANIKLADGLSTGLFVDMRDNRFRARSWAKAGSMLNLFCYSASFSVSAALSGAKTTSVDLSSKALERGRENFVSNGLDPAEHRFFKEDAMKFLARSVRRGDKYNFIVLDPPSFATVGKGVFSVKNGYGQAAADCLRLLAKGGRLLCVTNHTKTSLHALRKLLETSGEKAGRKLRYVKSLAPGLDCPAHPQGPWPSKSVLVEVD